jgi:hypothetical protein
MKKDEYPHTCHWCSNRHWCCDYRDYETNDIGMLIDCKHWKIGKCLKCVFNKNGKNLNDDETDRWFKRGCETFYPDAKKFCHKYIPYNHLTKWLYDKGMIK